MVESNKLKQGYIFRQVISDEEQDHLNDILKDAQEDSAQTQQLAMDASKLLSISESRLSQIKNRGFFKRIWDAFSGKNKKLDCQNQADLMKMQVFAWQYLQALQKQNLINASSIAVIANNLASLGDSLIETRGFLETTLQKLRYLEKDVQYLKDNDEVRIWTTSIKAHPEQYKRYPFNLKLILLISDFIIHTKNINLSLYNIDEFLLTLEYIGFPINKDITLIDFIEQLYKEIKSSDIIEARQLLCRPIVDKSMNADFIYFNSASTSLIAIFYLMQEFEKIDDILSDENLAFNEERTKIFLSKFFGCEFSYLQSHYILKTLVSELLSAYWFLNSLVDKTENKLGYTDIDFQKNQFIEENLSAAPRKLSENSYVDNSEKEIIEQELATEVIEEKFSINWERIDNLPFEPKDIKQITYFKNSWLILTYENIFRSEDAIKWVKVESSNLRDSYLSFEIKILEDICLIVQDGYSSEPLVLYSNNLIDWEISLGPKDQNNFFSQPTKDIIRYDGKWLWRFEVDEEYSYSEKRLGLFNTKQTSTLKKSIIYSTSFLDEPWKQWEFTPKFTAGITIKTIKSFFNNSLILSVCENDSNYLLRKYNSTSNLKGFISYFDRNKIWNKTEIELISNSFYFPSLVFFSWRENVYMHDESNFYTSTDGIRWNKIEFLSKKNNDFREIKDFMEVGDNVLISFRGGLFSYRSIRNELVITPNFTDFQKIQLSAGIWQNFNCKSNSFLSVFEPETQDEKFLMFGKLFEK